MNEYITLAEFKDLRRVASNDTVDDVMFQNRITRAARAIDDACGQPGTGFWADTVASARTFLGGGARLEVDSISSLADLAVTVDGVAVTVTALPYNAIAHRRPVERLARYDGGLWGLGEAVVTARWGWPEIPDAIKEANYLLANRRLFRRDSPEGTSGQSTDGPIRITASDSDVISLLTPYVVDGFA